MDRKQPSSQARLPKWPVVIPARAGSRGLLGKNILLFDGRPLLWHSVRFAQRFLFTKEIWVSSDSEEVLQCCDWRGIENLRLLKRPKRLATSGSPMVDCLKHVLDQYSEKPERLILLQPTSPLRQKQALEKACQTFLSKNFDSLISVTETSSKLIQIKNDQAHFQYPAGANRQSLPRLYHDNGHFYIFRSRDIEKGRLYGSRVMANPVDKIDGTDIDTRDDFDLAELLFRKYGNRYKEWAHEDD